MQCKFCKEKCQKAGRQANGQQRLFCRPCRKYQQVSYRYNASIPEVRRMIKQLLCEGVSIRGIARILKIAINTVLSTIRKVATSIDKPPISLKLQEVEVDELRTYVKHKGNEYWVAYALNRSTGKVIDFIVGKRSKNTLRQLIDTLLISQVKIIRTDNLNIYQSLIPTAIHMHGAYYINRIERRNLNLRTHLKRLSRRTICYSKSVLLLNAGLKIYFWG